MYEDQSFSYCLHGFVEYILPNFIPSAKIICSVTNDFSDVTSFAGTPEN
jgi:hypothetical protein